MSLIIGLVLLVACGCLSLWGDKRRFERRNAMGLQVYQSYWHKIKVTSLEILIGILKWVLAVLGVWYTAYGAFNYLA